MDTQETETKPGNTTRSLRGSEAEGFSSRFAFAPRRPGPQKCRLGDEMHLTTTAIHA